MRIALLHGVTYRVVMTPLVTLPTVPTARRELRPILILAAIALALLVFAHLASEVREGDSFAFDRWLLLTLRTPGDLGTPAGPRWLGDAMLDVTALGGTTVLTLVTIAASGYLIAARKVRTALFLVAAAVSGVLVEVMLKAWFNRPRPMIVPHLVDVSSLSFPSGHAMNSAIIYLTIGLIVARTLPHRRVQVYLMSLATLLTAGIGFSRVFLGVHYPTDVLAGWLVGSAWATLCWIAALYLQRRREIEPPPQI